MSFLSSILSVAKPVAVIGAQLLPSVLDALTEDASGAGSASASLVDFIADDQDRKIYAINNTTSTLTVTFQEGLEVAGSYGAQTESFELPPRNAADVTNDIENYTEDGTLSANYANVPGSTTQAGPTTRICVLALPVLAATTFVAFGGKITFERSTVTTSNTKVDQWTVRASTQLTSLVFDYNTKNGTKIHFGAGLQQPPTTLAASDFVYDIPMDQEGQATGVLTNFTVSLEAEEEQFVALLSPRTLVPFEQLPSNVQSRLRVS